MKKSTMSAQLGVKKTHQSQETLGETEVKNAAGGYVFAVDKFTQARRFLILGSEGGTFYVGEQKLTIENAKNLIECIKANGIKVLEMILEVSEKGLAQKNDPAIFALALACTFGNPETKIAAYKIIPRICRIGTHIFQFCDDINNLRGWSAGLRKGVAKWYQGEAGKLAYQLVKYRQRNGWEHKNVLQLAHPSAPTIEHKSLFQWVTGKFEPEAKMRKGEELQKMHPMAKVFEETIKMGKGDVPAIIKNLQEFNLPWEALNTEVLREPKIWEALIPKMPLGALIRNLGKLANIGLTKTNLDDASKLIASRLENDEDISKSRLHPISILFAYDTYGSGHGFRGDMSWTPVRKIQDALDAAFYKAFKNVTPSGKNVLVGIDLSGSMAGKNVNNSRLSASQVSAAMALMLAATEPNYEFLGFCGHPVEALKISKRMTLGEVTEHVRSVQGGSTDGSVPLSWALKNKIKVDAFVNYTDNETWCGEQKVFQALKEYRKSMGIEAKMITMATTGTGYGVGETKDEGSLDIVGFDSSAPQTATQFILGF